MPLLQNLMMLGQETGTFIEFCHIFINTLLRLVWKYCLKWFIQVIRDSNLMAFICFVLFCVFDKVIVLYNYLVSCSCKDILNVNVTYKMTASPKHWYAWQLIYSHDVIDTNDNFNFLGIGKKLPPVLLQIEVALLNKYLNQNIKIKNLFTNIESWSTFVKLVGNSALKKTIVSRMWRNLAFSCEWGTFSGFFSFYLSLVL